MNLLTNSSHYKKLIRRDSNSRKIIELFINKFDQLLKHYVFKGIYQLVLVIYK